MALKDRLIAEILIKEAHMYIGGMMQPQEVICLNNAMKEISTMLRSCLHFLPYCTAKVLDTPCSWYLPWSAFTTICCVPGAFSTFLPRLGNIYHGKLVVTGGTMKKVSIFPLRLTF